MPLYSFKAKKNTGEIYEGERDAADRFALFHDIKNEGAEIVSLKEIRPKGSGKFSFSFRKSIKVHELITFARNLGSMIEAGLSVSRALTVMERQTTNASLKTVLNNLNTEISQGKTLSDSMAKTPKIFNTLFIAMVKAGEESGTLANSLKTIALQMDRSYVLQKKIKGALMYPSVILGLMVIIAILMLTYIVPTLMKTFTEMKVALPWSTQLIVTVSNLLREHGFIVLGVVIVLFFIIRFWVKTKTGSRVVDLSITRIPVIGELVREVNTARTARTMSSLLNSGVAIIESVRITSEVVQNIHYKKVLAQVEENIKKGAPISVVFEQNPRLYPVFIAEMIAVGEETGKVGEMLLGVATYYEDDVEQRTKDMSTIIEPFLMVFIGLAVGFFALSMISPMYSLVNVI